MKLLHAALLALALAGCVTLPPDAFTVTPESLKQRQVESRRFEGIKEVDLLSASSNVLQDLGFSLENSETKLGVLTAAKQRDATDAAEIGVAILVALLGGGAMPISKDQTIRVSLVIKPVLGENGQPITDNFIVRVTFQRVVRRTDGSLYAESIKDPELLQVFFDRLSKSVFIEAQKI